MASDRRYQIFVSSTYRDLKTERDKILRTLAEFNYIPAGMEYFPAIDEEQFKFIKKIIDESDYYVVVLAGLYGTLASDGKSYTEKEFDYAREKGKPVCALLRESLDGLPSEFRETDRTNIELLGKFKDRLVEGRLVTFWTNENDLSLKMVQSLAVTSRTYPAPGWVRGGPEEPINLLRKIQGLENDNSNLKGELAQIKKATEKISDELQAFLRSEFEIQYKWESLKRYDAGTHNSTFKTTWAAVSEYVLPKLIAPFAVSALKQTIEYWIHEQTGNSFVSIRSDASDTVKLMLTAFDLVSNYSAEKVGGGVTEFIQVTPLGIRVSTTLKIGNLGLVTSN